jgi:Tfp pilus assembly protein PilX
MKKAVVLVVVFGVMLVISALALIALNFMTQESRVAEHKIRRIRGFYAAEAAKIDALERLRRNIAPTTIVSGVFPPPAGGTMVYRVVIGNGVAGYPAGGLCVRVTIMARGASAADCPNTSPSDFCVLANSSYDSAACPP